MIPARLVPIGILLTALLLYGLIFVLITAANRRAHQGKDIRE